MALVKPECSNKDRIVWQKGCPDWRGTTAILLRLCTVPVLCFKGSLLFRVCVRYGLGMVYYRQEKLALAEVHFRKALAINPQSSVLMCHIGVVSMSMS